MLQCINGKMKYKTNINLETLKFKKKDFFFFIKYSHKTLQYINSKREYKTHAILETLNDNK